MPKKKTELESKPESCWDVYSSARQRRAMDELADEYVDFLTRCKTERETIQYVTEQLDAAGFAADIDAGETEVYKAMRGKAVFIARKGARPLREGFRLLAAHADTPRLDLKQHPLYEDLELTLAKTHYYGGIRKHQWMARPLALHGVVVLRDGTVVEVTVGEDPGDPVFTISDLLPHLAYKQAEMKLSEAFEAEKMNILLGHEPMPKESKEGEGKGGDEKNRVKRNVLTLLNKKYGIVEDDFYSAELQAVPAGPARYVGLDGALIGGYGQDDRASVFTTLKAFLNGPKPEYTQIVLHYDKEEIGSEGSTGAKSRFLEYCLQDLAAAWDPDAKMSDIFLNGLAISADVNAPIEPDYPEVHDKLNAAFIGYGPVFNKYTGHRGKVGASEAHAEFVGWLRGVLDGAGVPWQMAGIGRVDLGGGGTVAKFLAEYGMDVIDMGPNVMSMHSPFEISSKADIYATVLALEAFLGN